MKDFHFCWKVNECPRTSENHNLNDIKFKLVMKNLMARKNQYLRFMQLAAFYWWILAIGLRNVCQHQTLTSISHAMKILASAIDKLPILIINLYLHASAESIQIVLLLKFVELIHSSKQSKVQSLLSNISLLQKGRNKIAFKIGLRVCFQNENYIYEVLTSWWSI